MKQKDAAILVNLGTPEQPTAGGVRKFLREFLSDRRVVEIPRLIWLPILYGFILTLRPGRVSKLYRSIWTEAGSPLKVITERLVEKLQARLQQQSGDAAVQLVSAYTYGEPSIASRVAQLQAQGVERILILPLYPQYSATTTGSIYDQYAKIIASSRNIPDIRIQKQYSQRSDYIAALVKSVQQHWAENGRAQKLLMSFHGIPQRNVDLGDPYADQCRQTASDLAKGLGLQENDWSLSFQSRLGKAEWLKPYTDKILAQWGAGEVESVDVICPAFAIDCLETLEEISVENRQIFIDAGGKEYRYIPCLNDSEAQLFLMSNIIEEQFA